MVLIGRRRRAAYGRVVISKGKKSTVTVSQNLAVNLRIRQDDKVKIVPLAGSDHEDRSGDLVLLKVDKPVAVAAATFSPLEDSLSALEASEGGDEIADEELMERFVGPYTQDRENALIKKGSVLTLRDDNGKKLDFIVSHVDVVGAEAKEESGKQYICYITMDGCCVLRVGNEKRPTHTFTNLFYRGRRRR